MPAQTIAPLIDKHKDEKRWLILGNGTSINEYSAEALKGFDGITIGNNRICDMARSGRAFVPRYYVNVELKPFYYFPFLEEMIKNGDIENYICGQGSREAREFARYYMKHTQPRHQWVTEKGESAAWNGTSLFMSLSLAYMMGMGEGSTCYIVGIDYCLNPDTEECYFTGEPTNPASFYLDENNGLRKAGEKSWFDAFTHLQSIGVDVVDLSPFGKLTTFGGPGIRKGNLDESRTPASA